MTEKNINETQSSKDQLDSESFNEFSNKKEEIKQTLTVNDVLNTMQFFLVDDLEKEYALEAIRRINSIGLKNSTIINICYSDKGNDLTEFEGIDLALKKIIEFPETKIIMQSWIPKDLFLSSTKFSGIQKDKLKILLSKPNFKFLELPYLPEDLENLFPVEKEIENKDIFNTINFNFGTDKLDKEYEGIFQEEMKSINLKNLREARCLFLEGKYDFSSQLQEFKSMDFILNQLASEPDKKVVIFTTFHLENLETILNRKSDEYKLLLNNPNVRFFTIGEDIKKLEDIFDEENNTISKEINTEIAFQNIMESEISRFLHDVKYWAELGNGSRLINEDQLHYLFNLSDERKNEKWIEFENKLIAMLQMQHPSFKKLPRVNNLQRIVDMYKYSRTKGLPEGTRFEGVFVDWDGCLYDNKNLKFNQNIIDIINEYKEKGHKITIRTGGNLEMKQKLLDEAGLNYKIENKTDYKGGAVEIAIDNDPQEFLLANSKIKSEKHIKV